MTERRILVLGGTGLLGAPVARRLRADGFAVRVLSRDPEKARRMFGPSIEVVAGDAGIALGRRGHGPALAALPIRVTRSILACGSVAGMASGWKRRWSGRSVRR
jgi:nucleoside-diphosphate-sugar epimerase